MNDDLKRWASTGTRRRFAATTASAEDGGSANALAKRVLNTGSGPASSARLHPAFANWTEVRLDVDPRAKPDIVGAIQDMRAVVPDASFDAIWASHNLEHLHSHEVNGALVEFRRILKDDGFAFVTSPDLEAIAQFLLEHGATAAAYQSAAGPITPLDMIFGHVRSVAEGNLFMSHKTGFTAASLGKAASQAGFAEVRVGQGEGFDLWALFMMPRVDRVALTALLRSSPQGFLMDA